MWNEWSVLVSYRVLEFLGLSVFTCVFSAGGELLVFGKSSILLEVELRS